MILKRDLFLPDSTAPPIEGLIYVSEFISQAEEVALITSIDRADTWSSALKRRVQHYGFRYDYRSRSLDESMRASSFPPWLSEFAIRVSSYCAMQKMVDQAIVNEYLPGQGIFKHVDCAPCFGPEVASLSLLSGCEMHFVNVSDRRVEKIYLEPRSLLVLLGPARYQWEHGIAARRSDIYRGERVGRTRRVSITFRTAILGSSSK